MSHIVSPTELQPSTLFTLGVMLQLDLVRHSMCDATLGMEKLGATLSTPLGAPIHQEPQRMSTSSWSLTPCAASAI